MIPTQDPLDFGPTPLNAAIVNHKTVGFNAYANYYSMTLGNVMETSVSLSDWSNFSIVANECNHSISFNSSCYVAIAFNPSSPGVHTATLTASGEFFFLDTLLSHKQTGQNSITLTGTGVIPTKAIVSDPAAPGTLYAGMDGAGVYKSTDNGANWSAASTQPSNLRVQSLILKPSDHTKLFAATYGGGVFTSADSGATWASCANTNLTNLNVLTLSVDNAGKLYAGTEAGVFSSADGCATWTSMNAGLP